MLTKLLAARFRAYQGGFCNLATGQLVPLSVGHGHNYIRKRPGNSVVTNSRAVNNSPRGNGVLSYLSESARMLTVGPHHIEMPTPMSMHHFMCDFCAVHVRSRRGCTGLF